MRQTQAKCYFTNDQTEILDIIGRVFECRSVDDMRKQVLDLLQSIFRADSANFFLATSEGDRLCLETAVCKGIDDKWVYDFYNHFHQYDPFRKYVLQMAPPYPKVCTTDQVISYSDLVKTKYYNNFLKPQSIHSQLNFNLRSRGKLLGSISLYRPANKPKFSSEEKNTASLMTPYLSYALEKALVVEHDALWEQVVSCIESETLHKGIIVLNERSKIVYLNDTARNIMRLFDGPNSVKPGVRHANLEAQLLQVLHEFCSRDRHAGKFQINIKAAKQVVSVKIGRYMAKGSQLYKFILEPEESLFQLSRLIDFGLTARQSEVVSLVCSGLTNTEISGKLCISELTVENHLRSIYKKTNVKNRTSLANYVFSQLDRGTLNPNP